MHLNGSTTLPLSFADADRPGDAHNLRSMFGYFFAVLTSSLIGNLTDSRTWSDQRAFFAQRFADATPVFCVYSVEMAMDYGCDRS